MANFFNISRFFKHSFLTCGGSVLLPFLLLASCSGGGGSGNEKTFAEVSGCALKPSNVANLNKSKFLRRDLDFALKEKHGFNAKTWGLEQDSSDRINQVLYAGGVTATYLDDDCWPDILYSSGDDNGMVAYINKGQQKGFQNTSEILSGSKSAGAYKRFTGTAVVDMDGDYKRELVFAGLLDERVYILEYNKQQSKYYEKDSISVPTSVSGISFADVDGDDYPDMFMGNFEFQPPSYGLPMLWKNNKGNEFEPYPKKLAPVSDTRFFFTPSFADVRGSGQQDLLIAADYYTSLVFQNSASGKFKDVTDKDVITDQNGMGAAVGDVDNDGKPDWFVTSVEWASPLNPATIGNRLYINKSRKGEIIFSDDTDFAKVREGGWGWGACFADFNNDGFLDIFQVNGFGHIPKKIAKDGATRAVLDGVVDLYKDYIGKPPKLFVNNGDGSFTEEAASWGLDVPSEGRGIACFDYDRDGDIDLTLLDHSSGIQFFENQTGTGKNSRFLNIRLVGKAPNTDAIGAKVTLKADVGLEFGVQKQMRSSHANSNYNGQNLPDIHFGLGEAAVVDRMEIIWTDNTGLICRDIKVNQFLVFDQRDRKWPKESGNLDCEWFDDIAAVL